SRIDAREPLEADAVVDRRHPGAAVPLGELDAEQAERGELRHQLDREVLIVIPLADVRTDFGLREFADAAPQQLLLLAQPEVHEQFRISRRCRRAGRAPRSTRTHRLVTATV